MKPPAIKNIRATAQELYTQELEALRALPEPEYTNEEYLKHLDAGTLPKPPYEKTDEEHQARVKELRDTAYQNNLKALKDAIPAAQRRQYEEQGYGKLLDATINHYSKYGLPTSLTTFKKKPVNVPRWRSAQELKTTDYGRLLQQKKHIDTRVTEMQKQYDAGQFPVNIANREEPEERRKQRLAENIAWFEERSNDLANQINEFDSGNESYIDERETHEPNKLSYLDKKGKPKQSIVRLYKLLRGNGYVDKDGDFIAQQSYHLYSPSASHASDVRKFIKEGILQYDDRSGVYIIPKNVVKKIDPYYKEYSNTVNEIFDGYETPNADVDSRYNSDLKFRNQFGYLMSLRGVKNLGKTTNKDGALQAVREFLTDHYGTFVAPPEPEYRELPKEINSLNDFRNVQTKYEELTHAIEQRRLLEQFTREQRRRQAELGFDPEGMSDEDILRLLAEPFQYSKGIKKLISETDGWHLAVDKEELYQRGQDMHNCVGDPRQGYIGAIRNHSKLILMRDNITAEIVLSVKDGVIKKAEINQTMLPYNKPVAPDPELLYIAKNLPGIRVEDLEEDDPEIEQKIIDAYYRGGFVQAEENKLLKAAEGYKGTPNVKSQLRAEAMTDGITGDEAEAILNNVMARLQKTESGKNGGAFGTPHKAKDRYGAIKKALSEVLY
jgi:hypothetical protein